MQPLPVTHRGRMIPPVQRAASCSTAVGKTKHEAQCLWQCADMFHSVSALRHIGTISHGPLTLGLASGNFRGSFDSHCDSPLFTTTDTRRSFCYRHLLAGIYRNDNTITPPCTIHQFTLKIRGRGPSLTPKV